MTEKILSKEEIYENWKGTGLLKNLYNKNDQANLAFKLEELATYMLNEKTIDSSTGRIDSVIFTIICKIVEKSIKYNKNFKSIDVKKFKNNLEKYCKKINGFNDFEEPWFERLENQLCEDYSDQFVKILPNKR